jgi:hypothetical protein
VRASNGLDESLDASNGQDVEQCTIGAQDKHWKAADGDGDLALSSLNPATLSIQARMLTIIQIDEY